MKKVYLVMFLLMTGGLQAQQLTLTPVASGFSSPVDIKHAGDGRLFIVEKPGRIRIIDTSGNVLPVPFLNIQSRVYSVGSEQGLLGLAFDPDYAVNGYFYVDYTMQQSGSYFTHISRFSVSPNNPDSALASSEEVLLEIYQPYSNHNGGHVAFGPDGYLYIGMGDGGNGGDPGNRAQNRDSLLGKMLRIDVSSAPGYAVPPSNPFVGAAGRDEIWAYGVRNPWRFSFDRLTGNLWIADVGQNVWEEVDVQAAASGGGENYGWRCYEGLVTYNTSGGACPPLANTAQPVYVYSHTSGGCSITGGYVYRGAKYANLYGKYFFTDYCTPTLRSLTADHAYTYTNYGTFSGSSYVSFGEDMYGELYLSSLGGQIYRLGDTACLPVAQFADTDTLLICGAATTLSTPQGRGFSYHWSFNGMPQANSDTAAWTATQTGTYSVQVTNDSGCVNTSADVYVIIDPVPAVSFSGLDTFYCQNLSPADTLNGLPAGGVFSGPGISGNVFDPTALGAGTYSVTYRYTTPQGCADSASIQTVVGICTGVPGLQLLPVSMSPNPFRDELIVRGATQVVLYNVMGERLADHAVQGDRAVLNTSALASGIYFVRLYDGDRFVTVKAVKE